MYQIWQRRTAPTHLFLATRLFVGVFRPQVPFVSRFFFNLTFSPFFLFQFNKLSKFPSKDFSFGIENAVDAALLRGCLTVAHTFIVCNGDIIDSTKEYEERRRAGSCRSKRNCKSCAFSLLRDSPMPAMEFEDRKWRDREALRHIIGQWNANRLDLFSLSEPNEVILLSFMSISCLQTLPRCQEFEFHGVMRFYFQDAGQKIATKCIRVSSTASTQAVIETLIEKFRPDMKMLHMAAYALYEIHPNGGKIT